MKIAFTLILVFTILGCSFRTVNSSRIGEKMVTHLIDIDIIKPNEKVEYYSPVLGPFIGAGHLITNYKIAYYGYDSKLNKIEVIKTPFEEIESVEILLGDGFEVINHFKVSDSGGDVEYYFFNSDEKEMKEMSDYIKESISKFKE